MNNDLQIIPTNYFMILQIFVVLPSPPPCGDLGGLLEFQIKTQAS
jgi:hypothetical protein